MKNAGFYNRVFQGCISLNRCVLSYNVLYYYRVTNVLLRPMQHLDLCPEYYWRLDSTLKGSGREEIKCNLTCIVCLFYCLRRRNQVYIVSTIRCFWVCLDLHMYVVINFMLERKVTCGGREVHFAHLKSGSFFHWVEMKNCSFCPREKHMNVHRIHMHRIM